MKGVIRRGLAVAGAISLLLLSATATFAEASLPGAPNTRRGPDRRRGSGSRCGTCQQAPGLFALVPTSNSSATLQAYPSFAWHVPETAGGETLTFMLTQYYRLEKRQEPLFEKKFQLDGTSGVMKLSLADFENAPALAVDEEYVWFAFIDCNPQEFGGNLVILESTVVRMAAEPEFVEQMQHAKTPLNQAQLYGSHGFWPDALELLLQERIIQADSPVDRQIVEAGLKELLASVGLEFFAKQPLMQTYNQPGHDYQPVEDRPETWISNKKEPPQMASVTHWAGCGGGPATAVYADS